MLHSDCSLYHHVHQWHFHRDPRGGRRPVKQKEPKARSERRGHGVAASQLSSWVHVLVRDGDTAILSSSWWKERPRPALRLPWVPTVGLVKQPVTVQQPITSRHDSSLWPVFRNSLINGKSEVRPCSFRYKQCEWSLEGLMSNGILFNPDLLEKGFICNYSGQMVIHLLQCPTTRSSVWLKRQKVLASCREVVSWPRMNEFTNHS